MALYLALNHTGTAGRGVLNRAEAGRQRHIPDSCSHHSSIGRGHSQVHLHTIGHLVTFYFGNQRDKCFGNLEECTNGFIMAFWLKPYYTLDNVAYISSGGQTATSMGVSLEKSGDKYYLDFRTSTQAWRVRQGYVALDSWVHMIWTWDGVTGSMYINGCLASSQDNPSTGTYNQDEWKNRFFIGCKNNPGGNSPAEMAIDELKVWDAPSDENLIHDIYCSSIQ